MVGLQPRLQTGHLDERSEGRFVETISTLAKTYPGLPLADPSSIGY